MVGRRGGGVLSRCAGHARPPGVPVPRAWRPPARASPASRTDERRRSGLPHDALIELVVRCRLGLGIDLALSCGRQFPKWRAAGRCDAGWRGRLTEVGEDVAHGGGRITRTHAQPGSAPLQKDVAKVLALLGHPAEVASHVCSTELIFLRSQDTGRLDGNFTELAEACWPINEEILRAVQPRQLMIIGNSEEESPWRFLRDKFASSWSPRSPVRYGRARAKLKTANFQFDGRTVSAIGFPHFSRFGVPNDLDARLQELGLPR